MIIEGNVLQSQPMEAGVPQGSPVSLILFAINTTGLIKLVEEKFKLKASPSWTTLDG
jgi:hypothetical protein